MVDVKRLWRWGGLALVLAAGGAVAEEAWKTVEKAPVLIKVRPRAEGKGKEVWAEGVVAASARDVQAALMDAGAYKQWMPYVEDSRLISEAEDGSRMVYTKLDLPVVSSRDYVLRVVDEQRLAEDGTGAYVQRWKAAEGVVAERKGIVRLRHNEGMWQVTARGEGQAHVVYRFSVDPAGSLPGWLASFGQTDGVLNTYKAVEKQARKLAEERARAGPGAR